MSKECLIYLSILADVHKKNNSPAISYLCKMNSYSELYRKISYTTARELGKKLPSAFNEIRKILQKNWGENIIGIFGCYRCKYKGKKGSINGSNLIEHLAIDFAKMGYVAVTGIGTYSFDGTLRKSDYLQKWIFENVLGRLFVSARISQMLVCITPRAVFLLSSKRSTYSFEEKSFFDQECSDKDFGVGFGILGKDPLDCEYLKERQLNSTKYYICCGLSTESCEKNKGKCPFFDQLEINWGTVELYVVAPHMLQAIVEDYRDIPEAMVQVLSSRFGPCEEI